MVNYENSKIYKIIGTDPTAKCYVGSTTKKYLSQRMAKHRQNYSRWKSGKKEGIITSFQLFDRFGEQDCQIILLESCSVQSKDELRAREQHYIEELDCVNKNAAISTKQDSDKRHYQKNKSSILSRCKKYYDNNKEEACLRVNNYRKANPDIIKERKKEYALENADKIRASRLVQYHCETCDTDVRKCKKARHDRTKSHLAKINLSELKSYNEVRVIN